MPRHPGTDDLVRWTVSDALARSPRAAGVFCRRRMACVGCAMAPFDTVAEAAEVYGIDPAKLETDLRDATAADGAGDS